MDRAEAGVARNVSRRGTQRGPAQGVRGVTSAPLEKRLRVDHIPCTMRCAAFREAVPKRKPWRGRD